MDESNQMHSTKQRQKNCVVQNGKCCCFYCCCCRLLREKKKLEKWKRAHATDVVVVVVSVSCGTGCYIQMTIVHHRFHLFQRVFFRAFSPHFMSLQCAMFQLTEFGCITLFVWGREKKHDRCVYMCIDFQIKNCGIFFISNLCSIDSSLLAPIFHCTLPDTNY